jgi:hypothetical protein
LLVAKLGIAVNFTYMIAQRYTVTCHWDDEAQVWFVADTDVPGLATEAATVEELERKLLVMVPELLGLNGSAQSHQSVPFELIARKHELAKSA